MRQTSEQATRAVGAPLGESPLPGPRSLAAQVAMAIGAHRRGLACGRRAYAARRGWSSAFGLKVEADAGGLALAVVDAALLGTGFRLVVVPDSPPTNPNQDRLTLPRAARRLTDPVSSVGSVPPVRPSSAVAPGLPVPPGPSDGGPWEEWRRCQSA